MPNHDFWCPSCKFTLKDQYRSIEVGGKAAPPDCPHCTYPMIWIIPRLRTDLRTDGEGASGYTFQKFTCRDGRNNLVTIDSLTKLRQVERESAQLAANGEGQQIRFRAFEQDHSNMSVNTFGEIPTERPSEAGKSKFGLRHNMKVIDAPADGSEPEYAYGPGVNDSNTSPLAE